MKENKTEKETVAEEEQETLGQKIINILVNIFTTVMVVLSLFLVVVSVVSNKNYGVPTVNNKSYLRVQSSSMQGTINKGDLIVVEKVHFFYNDTTQYLEPSIEIIENESIISFFYDIDADGKSEIVTHKVIAIDNKGALFMTQGTYVEEGDTLAVQTVSYSSVIGVYNGTRVPVVGAIYGFLMDTPYAWGFALCVLCPMFAIFLFKGYKLIVTIMETRKENAEEIARKNAQLTEEELARQKEVMRAEILKELGISDKKDDSSTTD